MAHCSGHLIYLLNNHSIQFTPTSKYSWFIVIYMSNLAENLITILILECNGGGPSNINNLYTYHMVVMLEIIHSCMVTN